MQHKSAVWVFTILITIATLYSLSFSFVAKNFESKADSYASKVADSLELAGSTSEAIEAAFSKSKREFLRDSANAVAYPVVGKTYSEVKRQELNLGLDLQGGMSVTLEVSIADLVKSLSDYSQIEEFQNILKRAEEGQSNSQDDFITLFENEFNNSGSDLELRRIFQNLETGTKFNEAKTNDAVFDILREEAKDAINNTENIIKKRIDRFGVAQPIVQKESFSGRINVELPGVDDKEEIRDRLKSTANLEFWHVYPPKDLIQYWGSANNGYVAKNYPNEFAIAQDSTMADSIEALPDAAKNAFFDKVSPLRKLDIQSPLQNSQNIQVCGYSLARDTSEVNSVLKSTDFNSAFPRGTMFRWDASNTGDNNVVALYALRDDSGRGKPLLDGKSITNADNQFDPIDGVMVNMTMDQNGTYVWGEMTEEAYQNKTAIAITMDDYVYSAPGVSNGAIKNGSSRITMGSGSSLEAQTREAEGLAQLLNAGALPAPAKILSETVVGPSIGAENISAGLWSFGIALLVVLLYMIFYYRGAGVVADIALIANLFFLLGALAAFGAALTLPGIAGIVLTVGMAVDANVLIFERIKEEMRSGKGLVQALKDGYNRAYSAIIDANITTLVTAIILSIFGSGPIKGFATTLIIGIFTSLFSAIFLTRLIFFNRIEKKKSISFSSKMTENWFTKMNFDFVKKRKLFYAISGIVIVLGIVSLSTRGLDYGVDFEGGRTYTVAFDEAVSTEEVRNAMTSALVDSEGKGANTVVKSLGEGGNQVKITTNFLINNQDVNVDKTVSETVNNGLTQVGKGYNIVEKSKVDPTISDDFRTGARNATIFSLIFIFAYIAIRFRKWQFGVGALIAMLHDVVIVLIMFSIGTAIFNFSLEIDQAFIAAILTVIGYSINDTVVVFDRIREYLGLYRKETPKTVINNALNSTLSRTINTSLSTFAVLLTIFIFAGDNIKGFVFALMVGVVVGTYSSLFIATPSVIDLTKEENF